MNKSIIIHILGTLNELYLISIDELLKGFGTLMVCVTCSNFTENVSLGACQCVD